MTISHHPKSVLNGIRHNLTFLVFTNLGAIVPQDTDLSMQDFILYFNRVSLMFELTERPEIKYMQVKKCNNKNLQDLFT